MFCNILVNFTQKILCLIFTRHVGGYMKIQELYSNIIFKSHKQNSIKKNNSAVSYGGIKRPLKAFSKKKIIKQTQIVIPSTRDVAMINSNKNSISDMDKFLMAVDNMDVGKTPQCSKRLTDLFRKNGFVKSDNKEFYKPLSDETVSGIEEKYGLDFGRKICSCFKVPIDNITKLVFDKFLKIGNNFQVAKEHFNEMFLIFSKLNKKMDAFEFDNLQFYFEKNPDSLQVIHNLAKKPPEDEKTLKALDAYKTTHYSFINNVLRSDKPVFYGDDVQQEICDLNNFLNTQNIEKSMTLYRGDGLSVLKKVKMPDGTTVNLAEKMLKAQQGGKQSDFDKVREFVLDNEIVATQKGFTSTSLKRLIGNNFATCSYDGHQKMLWEYQTVPGTKGAYIEPLTSISVLASENEVLLQKNSQIKIDDLYWEDGIWKAKGKISN